MSSKASTLRTYWIIIRSIGITLWISIVFLVKRWLRLSEQKHETMLRWWAGKLLTYIKLSYQVHNPHKVTFKPGIPYIIMSNHLSLYDIPLIFVSLPGRVRMIAKKELFRVPVWGQALKASGFIAIDRSNRERAIHDLEIAKNKMAAGTIIWIAPEGTRSRTGKLMPFKKGGFRLALDTQATILPVAIKGSNQALAAGTLDFHLGVKADIYLGKPVAVSDFQRRQSAELMAAVEGQIRALLASDT
jgi:1-acyl-sn-glycerol-3-phosphate acyltransferase